MPHQHKTTVHTGEITFTRHPADARERQASLVVMFTGQLAYESWIPEAGPVSHNGAIDGAHLTAEFVGSWVESRADVARALRALADHLDPL